MGPIARNVTDLAHLLDVMVGYDPEDPLTAAGIDKHEGSYTRFLDSNGLKGARVGVLRESVGLFSEPDSPDFKKVDTVFDRDITELKAAGAVVIDPVVIPDFKALLAKRTGDPALNDEALRLYLARNPNSPFRTREDIAKSPLLALGYPQPKTDNWTRPLKVDLAAYGDYLQARERLMINILKVMADNRLDAIVHKTVEHQPTLIREGVNPPYVNNKGIPTFNTFLVYCSVITVPSGSYDRQPTGRNYLFRPAIQRAHAAEACLCI